MSISELDSIVRGFSCTETGSGEYIRKHIIDDFTTTCIGHDNSREIGVNVEDVSGYIFYKDSTHRPPI